MRRIAKPIDEGRPNGFATQLAEGCGYPTLRDAVMRKTIIALAMLGTIVAQAHATDPLDTALKNRHTMVAAVALLMTLPPKCAIDNKNPPADLIALFVVHYGHKGDDVFVADVKAQTAKILKIPEPDRSKRLDLACGYGVLLSEKVRDVARLNGKIY